MNKRLTPALLVAFGMLSFCLDGFSVVLQDQEEPYMGLFFSSNKAIKGLFEEWENLQTERLQYMNEALGKTPVDRQKELQLYYDEMYNEVHGTRAEISVHMRPLFQNYQAWLNTVPEDDLVDDDKQNFQRWSTTEGKRDLSDFEQRIVQFYQSKFARVKELREKWYGAGSITGRDLQKEREWREKEDQLIGWFNADAKVYMTLLKSQSSDFAMDVSPGDLSPTTDSVVNVRIRIFGGTPPYKAEAKWYRNDNTVKTVIKQGRAASQLLQMQFNEEGKKLVTVTVSDSSSYRNPLEEHLQYSVTEIQVDNSNPERDDYYADARTVNRNVHLLEDTAPKEGKSRSIVAFAILPRSPRSERQDSGGAYLTSPGRSIQFHAYVTYSDNVSEPEDITQQILDKDGWVNGPEFLKYEPGIYTVSADFSVVGKRKLTITVKVTRKDSGP